MDSRVRKRALPLRTVVILNQGGKSVQLRTRSVPSHEHFLGVRAQVQCQHCFLIFHVDFDLVGGFGVGDCEGRMDDDLGFIGVGARAEEGADYALLVRWAADTVVEDGEEGLESQFVYVWCVENGLTWGCITTRRGAVVGCAPTAAGPRGRVRCRKPSCSAMLGKVESSTVAEEAESSLGTYSMSKVVVNPDCDLESWILVGAKSTALLRRTKTTHNIQTGTLVWHPIASDGARTLPGTVKPNSRPILSDSSSWHFFGDQT